MYKLVYAILGQQIEQGALRVHKVLIACTTLLQCVCTQVDTHLETTS